MIAPIVLLCIMVYCLICAFEMDEELLKRQQKPIADPNGFVAAKSDDMERDDSPETDTNQWSIGFFDDVCSMQSMKMVMTGLLCPCTMQNPMTWREMIAPK